MDNTEKNLATGKDIIRLFKAGYTVDDIRPGLTKEDVNRMIDLKWILDQQQKRGAMGLLRKIAKTIRDF